MDPRRNCGEILLMLLTVLGGFILEAAIGGAYSYDSIFDQYNNETIKTRSFEKYKLDIFSLGLFGLSASMGLGGFMSTIYGHRKTIFLGSVIMNFGIIITTFVAKSRWYLFTYGFICGSGAGLMFSVSLATACQWFKFYKSFGLSIVLSGFSFGKLLVQFTIRFMNPSWSIFSIIGIEFFIIQIIGLILMQTPKKDSSEIEKLLLSINDSDQDLDIQPHIMIMEFDFWIIWLIFYLNAFGSLFIRLQYQIYSSISNEQNGLSIYIISLFIVIGQGIWGISSDRLSMKTVFCTFALGSSFMYGILLLLYQQIETYEYFYYMIYPSQFWQNGIMVIIPGLIVKRFGQKYFAINYGITWTAYTFAGILTSQLTKFINNVVVSLSVFSVLSFISFLLVLFYAGNTKRIDNIFWKYTNMLLKCIIF